MSATGRERSGVPGLDDVLHGGLISGRVYLVNGEPGAGKTTLAMQYLLQGVREGESVLYVTLSETADELRASAASHGWSLDGIEIVELISNENDLLGELDVTMYHPWEVDLHEVTKRIIEAVERVAPRRMVLDSLSELCLMADGVLRYRRQILALKQFLMGRDCTALFLDDRTTRDIDTQVHSVVHGVIALDRNLPVYGPVLRQLHVTKFRGSDFISGQQDCRLTRAGLEIFPRVTPSEHGAVFSRDVVRSGVPALDDLLGGGTVRGTATLLLGPAGSGKSTIAAQYAVETTRRGAHAIIYTFEEAKSLVLYRLRGLGFSFDEGVGPGKLMVTQIDPVAMLPDEFVRTLRHAVEGEGATMVVIDSLNGYLNALAKKRPPLVQLHELLSYLNNRGVTTFVVSTQTGMVGDGLRDVVDASYLADAVVLFRMYEHHGTVRKAISVVKKRGGPHEDSIRDLCIDAQGVHVGPPLTHLRGVLTGIPVEVEVSVSPRSQSTDEREARS